MSRRKKSNRRRRRGRFGFLYKLLSVLVICVVLVFAVTLFFRADYVEITGQNRYTEQQILAASGIELGDNLFLMNKYTLANNLVQKLPYIEQVRINRRLPDTLLIDVSECLVPVAIVQEGTAWLVSPSGKIVERREPSEAADLAVVDGCTLLSPSVGSEIVMPEEQQVQKESVLALLSALRAAEILDQVSAVHLDSVNELSMEFGGRFRVHMSYGADYERQLLNLQAVIEKLETNQTGTIDLTKEGEAYFRPQ